MDILLTRLICSLLLLASVGGSWDVWWHLSIGRESFWSAPHLVLYTGVAGAVFFGLWGYYKTRERVWRNLALVLILIPLSAPFDEFWHRWYGVEKNDSIWIIWSPPHVLLVLAIAVSYFVLLKFIKRDSDKSAQLLFGSISLSGILGSLIFLTGPVLPLDAHHVLGFYGAGFFVFVYVLALLYSQDYFTGVARAIFPAIFFTTLISTNYHSVINPNLVMQVHPHPPQWIYVFAFLIPAFCIDIIKSQPAWIKGIIAGFLYGLIFYGTSNMFIESKFVYSTQNLKIAVGSSIIAGLLAGLLIRPKILSER